MRQFLQEDIIRQLILLDMLCYQHSLLISLKISLLGTSSGIKLDQQVYLHVLDVLINESLHQKMMEKISVPTCIMSLQYRFPIVTVVQVVILLNRLP